ncbi:uncharacterized protein CEXT_536621 [Caerostris extrusa]|uniref:Uncharacterized protein n=1 Tax=Caerostris extrusa TaxID=172846 RepID=A0AAV4QB69_CAEEX|nr:uncharacterized protein CEXT_536621 [Caerostris extrusa]
MVSKDKSTDGPRRCCVISRNRSPPGPTGNIFSAQLEIPMDSRSLPEGILRLACEASISNFVTSISKELLISREHSDQPQHHIDPQEEETTSGQSSVTMLGFLLVLSMLMWKEIAVSE